MHQELDALHAVTTPSQVMETPATLEHVVATQLKVELEQLVVHIVEAFAEGAIPVDTASATTTRRPIRIKSLRIFPRPFFGPWVSRPMSDQQLVWGGSVPHCRMQTLWIVPQTLHLTSQLARQVSSAFSQLSEQVHQVLDALHEVTTPSQVIDVPATLVQVVATQLRVELEQLVVHIVEAFAEGAIPVDAANATTARSPARIRSLRIVIVSLSLR